MSSKSSKKVARQSSRREDRASRSLAAPAPDSGDSEIRKIQRMLEGIPSAFKKMEGFNSLEHVIEIMKSDDVEARRTQLETDCYELESAMETIVSLHYESFNKAIQNYTSLLENVKDALTNVQLLHEISDNCSTLFSSRSHSVNNMYIQSLEYTYMIDILDKVEFIKQVPESYQSAMQDGRYLEAAKTLVTAEEMLNQEDMLNVAALLHLRELVIDTRLSFHNTIIEVLHDVCYLKFLIDLEHSEDISMDVASQKRISMIRSQRAYAVGVLDKTSATAANFQVESAEQMLKTWSPLLTQLVEALYVLGRVKEGASAMLGRVRSEVRHMVQRTVHEIAREYDIAEHASAPNTKAADPSKTAGQAASNASNTSTSFVSTSSVLRELEVSFEPSQFARMLSVLFERCKLILANHKFVCSAFLKKQKEIETAIAKGTLSPTGRKGVNAGNTGLVSDDESFFSTASRSTYVIENVWYEMQQEILSLLSFYIEAESSELGSKPSMSMTAGAVMVPSSNSALGTKLFSFSRSAAFSAPDEEQNAFNFEDMELGEPSAFNLPPLYPLVVSFSESAVHHALPTIPSLEKGKDMLPQSLRIWLDDYVNSLFLNHIKLEYKLRVGDASEGPEAFKMKDRPRQAYSYFESQRPILSSVIEVFKCLKELFQDTVYMPTYAKDFHGIMEMILKNFLDVAQSHFDSVVKDTETGRMLTNDQVLKAATSDPQWKRALSTMALQNQQGRLNFDPTNDGSGADSARNNLARARGHQRQVSLTGGVGGDLLFTSEELPQPIDFSSASIPSLHADGSASEANSPLGYDTSGLRDQRIEVEINLYKGQTMAGQPLTKKNLIGDVSKLEKLALMHDSLSWLCDRMEQIDKSTDLRTVGAAIGGGHGSGSFTPFRIKRASAVVQTPGRKPGGGTAEEDIRAMGTPVRKHIRDKSIAGGAPVPAAPKFSPSILDLVSRVKELSEKCLIALRTEYRVRCFNYLDGLRRASWTYDADTNRPDQCILEFNADLTESHEIFYVYLPTVKIRYIYGTLPRLISSILISSLSRLDNFNRTGVMKMIRDVFSLQQTLTNVITFDPEPLDRVRRYYELLLLTPEEVFQHIQEHMLEPWKLFSFPEYRTLLEFLSPNRQVPETLESELRLKLAQAAKPKEKRREATNMPAPPATPTVPTPSDLNRAALASPGASIRRKPYSHSRNPSNI